MRCSYITSLKYENVNKINIPFQIFCSVHGLIPFGKDFGDILLPAGDRVLTPITEQNSTFLLTFLKSLNTNYTTLEVYPNVFFYLSCFLIVARLSEMQKDKCFFMYKSLL